MLSHSSSHSAEPNDLAGLLRSALENGWRYGLLLGGVWVAYNLINNLGNLNTTGYRLLNTSLFPILIALYGFVGLRQAYATGRITNGTLAAIGASLISSLIAISALWIVTYVFMDTLRHNPFLLEDYRRSGASSMDAFIFDDNLVPTFLGPFVSLALGVAAGAAGGVIGKWMRSGLRLSQTG